MKNASIGEMSQENRTDWTRVRDMTDADIRHDADSPRTTTADWEGALFKEAGVVVGRARTRGPNRRPVKEQVAIRLSPEVLATFRATGHGWQTRINEALKDWLKNHSPA